MFDNAVVTVMILAGVLTAVALPAQAEIYKYQDPVTGKLVISNQPPPAAAHIDLHQGEGQSVSTESTPPVVAPVDTAPPAVPPTAAAEPTHRTKPVDTLELAHIKDGMSEAEVQRRLGTPARVEDLGTVQRLIRDRRNTRYGMVAGPDATGVPVTRTRWVYTGNSRVGDAVITFHNGEVTSAERVR